MENKHYREFLDLFRYLLDAGTIIFCSAKNVFVEESETEKINQSLLNIEQTVGNINIGDLPNEDLLDEIQKNLLRCFSQQDKESYLVRILRKFESISTYLNIGRDKKYYLLENAPALRLGKLTYGESHVFTHITLERYRKKIEPFLDLYNATMPEKYVILCFHAYSSFFMRLDALCLDFQIDLIAIQTKNTLNVFNRDMSNLFMLGYSLEQIGIKESKNLTYQQIEKSDQKNTDKESKLNRYIIKKADLIQQVYEVSKNAFNCDFFIFRESIETANFNPLDIKKQNIVQDLTYRLSGIMDNEWYSDVCKKMNWEKSICSGQRQKLQTNQITKKIDKILKRPKKE